MLARIKSWKRTQRRTEPWNCSEDTFGCICWPQIKWASLRRQRFFGSRREQISGLRGSCSNKVERQKRERKRDDEKGGSFAASRLPFYFLLSGVRVATEPLDNGRKFPCFAPPRFLAFPKIRRFYGEGGRINNAAWYRGIIARRREESSQPPDTKSEISSVTVRVSRLVERELCRGIPW